MLLPGELTVSSVIKAQRCCAYRSSREAIDGCSICARASGKWLTGERGNSKKADFVGMEGFGASAPIDELYAHFGITAENVVAKVEALLA